MRFRSFAPADAALATLFLLVLVLLAFRGSVMQGEGSGFVLRSDPGLEHGASRSTPSLRVNLNRADMQRLASVPGVGPVLAKAIVEFRAAHGPFQRLEDLSAVPGIGSKRLEKIGPYLMLDGEVTWSIK